MKESGMEKTGICLSVFLLNKRPPVAGVLSEKRMVGATVAHFLFLLIGNTRRAAGRFFLIVTTILLVPILAQSENLSFWSGKVGKATVKLFLTGPAYPDNYIPSSDAEAKFYTKHKNAVQGYYLYDKYKTMLSLIGTTLDGRWKFEEHQGSICTNCRPNGYFDGLLTGDTVSGFWVSADSSKRLPFRIEKAPLLKRTIFGWLRGGEWALDNAEGFYGANTMTELGKDQRGRWTSGGSAISGGMREGYESQLSKEDKKYWMEHESR